MAQSVHVCEQNSEVMDITSTQVSCVQPGPLGCRGGWDMSSFLWVAMRLRSDRLWPLARKSTHWLAHGMSARWASLSAWAGCSNTQGRPAPMEGPAAGPPLMQ